MRDDYAAEARDEHVTELDNILYIISSCQYQNQQISLENKRSLKQRLRLKKKYTIPSFLLIS